LYRLFIYLGILTVCSCIAAVEQDGRREFQQIELWYFQEEYEKTLSALQSFVTNHPQSEYLPQALFYMGDIYYRQGKYQESLDCLRQSLLHSPSPELRLQVLRLSAACYYRLKDYIEALEAYQKAQKLSKDPREKEYLQELAGHTEEVLVNHILQTIRVEDLLRLRGREILSSKAQGFVYYRLAELYYQQAKYQLALDILREYREKFPDHPYRLEADALWLKTKTALKTTAQAPLRRIGCLLPLTGQFQSVGQMVLRGIKLALLLAPTGPQGYNYELIVKDTAITTSLEELASNETVWAIIGLEMEGGLRGLVQLADDYRIPLVLVTPLPEGLMGSSDYCLSIATSGSHWAGQLAEYAIRVLHIADFSVLYPTTRYGLQLMKYFQERVLELGGSIYKNIPYQSPDMDLAPQLKELLDHTQASTTPQALFLPTDYYGLRLILPQITYHIKGKLTLLSCCYEKTPSLGVVERKELEGAVFLAEFFPQSDRPGVKRFVGEFERTFGLPPDHWAARGYDALNLIFYVLKSNQIRDRGELRDSLFRVKYYPGVTGNISILEDGSVEKSPHLIRIEGGRLVLKALYLGGPSKRPTEDFGPEVAE